MDVWMHVCMYGWMDGWMYGCMDADTQFYMHARMHACMYVSRPQVKELIPYTHTLNPSAGERVDPLCRRELPHHRHA